MKWQDRASIRLIVGGFVTMIVLVIGLQIWALRVSDNVLALTDMLYRHPLTVSSSVLRANAAVIAMHRYMKDVALAESTEEMELAISRVADLEREVFRHFDLVLDRFLGDPQRIENARSAFANWRPIRSRVIAHMRAGRRARAAAITKGVGADYVEFLIAQMDGLTEFAHNKAAEFIADAEAKNKQSLLILYAQIVTVVIIGGLITTFVMVRVARIQGALRDSESRFRHVAEAMSDWIWETDADYRLTYVSQPSEDGAALLWPIALGDNDQRTIEGGLDRPDFSRTLKAQAPFRDLRYQWQGRDEKQYHLSVSGNPVFADGGSFVGYIGTASDITAQVEAERRANLASQRLSTAIASMSEAFALWDAEDRLVMNNRRMEDLNQGVGEVLQPGTRFEDFVRTALEKGLYPDAIGREAEWLKWRMELHRNPGQSFEIRRKGGTWLLVREQRLPDGHTLILATDVTEQRKVEDRLREAHKNEALGQMTAGVAHEFNNLFMAVSGNLELIGEAVPKGSEASDRIDTLVGIVARGGELTQSMLSYVGLQPLDPAAIDVEDAVRRSIRMLRPMLGHRHSVEFIASEDLQPVVADVRGLHSALINLVGNARDAMPDGGVVRIEARNAEPREILADKRNQRAVDGDFVRVSVVDRGTGMADDVKLRALDPFFTTKEVGQGTGLGLSMVYGFVNQLGGFVDIASEPGRGTTVSLYLPCPNDQNLNQALATDAPPGISPPEPEIVRAGRDRLVALVVEDEPVVLDVVTGFLEAEGCTVHKAVNGLQALQVAEELPSIDLLLTDVVMPGGIDGVRLAMQVAKNHPSSRLLLMTGYTTAAIREMGIALNDTAILRKPFKKADLVAAFRDLSPQGDRDQTGKSKVQSNPSEK